MTFTLKCPMTVLARSTFRNRSTTRQSGPNRWFGSEQALPLRVTAIYTSLEATPKYRRASKTADNEMPVDETPRRPTANGADNPRDFTAPASSRSRLLVGP